MDAFAHAGGTFIDTAHVYANWASETPSVSEKTIGKWLKANNMYKQIIIGTKGAHPSNEQPNRLSRADIIGDLDESLDYLGLSTIDLYWLHRDDRSRPVADILATMNECVSAGKIRYFAASNWRTDRLEEANTYASEHSIAGFVASQISWSFGTLNDGAIEDKTIVDMDKKDKKWYERSRMTVLGFGSQAKGYFTKLDNNVPVSEGVLHRYDSAENRSKLARTQLLAKELDTTVTAIVLAYMTCNPVHAIPLVGCNSIAQVLDSAKGGDIDLTAAQIRYLDGKE